MACVGPSVSLEEVNMAISRSFQALGYSFPTREQEEAVRAFVNGSDGCGKESSASFVGPWRTILSSLGARAQINWRSMRSTPL